MTKHKIEDLSGDALNWAVAKAEGWSEYEDDGEFRYFSRRSGEHDWLNLESYSPSAEWSVGGPIIERERIELTNWGMDGWMAKATSYTFLNTPDEKPEFAQAYGQTSLVAAMRCYVASKLGEEIEIPDPFHR